MAQAYGWSAERVERPDEVRGALERALHADAPALVEMIVDKEAAAPVTYYETVVERTA